MFEKAFILLDSTDYFWKSFLSFIRIINSSFRLHFDKDQTQMINQRFISYNKYLFTVD